MKSILASIALLLTSVVSAASATDAPVYAPHYGVPVATPYYGVPIYAPEIRFKEVGRLYPTPYVVPTYWRNFHYRPTAIGRAARGPWRVSYSPGPPMLYVPN